MTQKPIIIIPTYNERENIKELITTIRDTARSPGLEILVVDSASPDRTADVVKEIKKSDAGVHLLSQSQKLGLGKAYLDGMKWVLGRNYDVVVTMDADFSHHPRYLDGMIQAMQDNDLVVGSRYVRGGALKSWPIRRQILSKCANWYARVLTGVPFHDLTAGFHCFRTTLLSKILKHELTTEGYAFLVELKYLAVREGARTKEIPIVFSDRTKGASKISSTIALESMLFILRTAMKRLLPK